MRINQEVQQNLEQKAVLALLQEIFPEVIEGFEAPYRLFRYDKGDDRFYYRMADSHLIPYLSVTSFTHKSLPTSQYLLDWYGKMGSAAANQYKKTAAEYGTILHIEAVEAFKENRYSWRTLEKTLTEKMPQQYRYLYGEWLWTLKKDLMAFFQFRKDAIVNIIALEIPVYSDKYRLAGTIDMVCEIKFGGKTVYAIVDFKSGKKGFWEAHELQLHCYKELWNERFGDLINVTHVFNFAPNNWTKKPTYKLKNQTKSHFATSASARMQMAMIEGWIIPPDNYFDIVGEVSDLTEFDYTQHLICDKTMSNALANA